MVTVSSLTSATLPRKMPHRSTISPRPARGHTTFTSISSRSTYGVRVMSSAVITYGTRRYGRTHTPRQSDG